MEKMLRVSPLQHFAAAGLLHRHADFRFLWRSELIGHQLTVDGDLFKKQEIILLLLNK